MNKLTLITAGTLIAALAVAQGIRTEYFATLTGQGKGKARYRVRVSPPQGELQVEGERLARNQMFTVNVGASSWMTGSDAFGKIRVAQRWTSNLPRFAGGTQVTVTNSAGVIVLSGTMQ